MNGLSDSVYEDLLQRAREGCLRARGELLDRYRKYLKALVRAQLCKPLEVKADASDLVQETFLAAHDQFDQFRGANQLQLLAWLRTILASRLARHARHHLTHGRSLQLERRLTGQLDRSSVALDQSLVQRGPSPSEAVSQNEQLVRVASAIEDLPADYRTVILLRHVRALPFAEIAASMERSVESVKKLHLRALACLQRSLEGRTP
jgi:RNA polymerase sigma-70 factor (ECF subfamily)